MASVRDWADLPRDLTLSIFSRLTAFDTLTRAQFVCKSWLEFSKDPILWSRIEIRSVHRFNFHKMYPIAIDRSCGGTVEIDIEFLGDDQFLRYISHGSSRLKRLRLYKCCDISDEALIEAFAKLPMLEEVELTRYSVDTKPLEALGLHCPRLRSLKMESDQSNWHEFDAEAKCIAKNMAGLVSLSLTRNSMTDGGLRAILDGCSGLESLHIHECPEVGTRGSVWERCEKQLKRFRHSMDDSERHKFTNIRNMDFYPQFFFDCLA